MTKKYNMKDWGRGTTPPFTIQTTKQSDGSPYSLEGCVIAFAVRSEDWENSLTDNTALIKRRVFFYRVNTFDDLASLTPQVGDVAWLNDTESAVAWDGTAWNEVSTNENNVPGGTYVLRFTRAETMLPVGRYYHSLDMQFPNGEIQKIIRGYIDITSNTVNEI